MHTRIEVATQIYLGLMVIYRDAVLLEGPLFAQQAIRMASQLIAEDSRLGGSGSTSMPAASAPMELDHARQAAEEHQEIIQILKAAHATLSGPGSRSLQ